MLALSTDTLKGYGLDRIFEFASQLQFDAIDLALDTKQYDTFNADYLKKLSKTYNIPIIALQTPKEAGVNTVNKSIELAKHLNCQIVVVQPPKIFDRKYANWLRHEAPIIRKKEQLSIALENAANKTYLGFIPEYTMNNINELRKFKHACLDTTRVAQKKEDLMRAYNFLKNYLVHIHLSNMHRNRAYYLPHEGMLPLESFLAKLKQDDFKGAISIKVNPKYIEAEHEDRMLKNLQDIKEFYEKFFVKS